MLASSRTAFSQAAKAMSALPKSNIVKLAARMESTAKTATEEVGSFTASDRVALKNIGEKVGKLENHLEQLTKDVHSFQIKTIEEFSSVRGQVSSTREGMSALETKVIKEMSAVKEGMSSLETKMTKAISDSQKEMAKAILDSQKEMAKAIIESQKEMAKAIIESQKENVKNIKWAVATICGFGFAIGGVALGTVYTFTNEAI